MHKNERSTAQYEEIFIKLTSLTGRC